MTTQPINESSFGMLKFDVNGLITCVVQDADTREVLMVAWMNAQAFQRTIELGEAVFWSRTRGRLWHKGGTSGNIQKVVEIRYDCDGDTLLLLVNPAGPACHTGRQTCFYRKMDPSGVEIMVTNYPTD
jgi:phosphoribosyl-AMP cyclohydrolase